MSSNCCSREGSTDSRSTNQEVEDALSIVDEGPLDQDLLPGEREGSTQSSALPSHPWPVRPKPLRSLDCHICKLNTLGPGILGEKFAEWGYYDLVRSFANMTSDKQPVGNLCTYCDRGHVGSDPQTPRPDFVIKVNASEEATNVFMNGHRANVISDITAEMNVTT